MKNGEDTGGVWLRLGKGRERGPSDQLLGDMKGCVMFLKSLTSSAAVLAILLCGCSIPYPHKTIRSFRITGRVVDAETGLPIAGARIQPLDYLRRSNSIPATIPDLTTTPVAVSDVDGCFKLPRTKNMRWTKTVLAPCYVGVSDGRRYSLYIVTKPGYVPVDFDPRYYDREANHLKQRDFIIGDIQLSAGDSLVPKSWQHGSK